MGEQISRGELVEAPWATSAVLLGEQPGYQGEVQVVANANNNKGLVAGQQADGAALYVPDSVPRHLKDMASAPSLGVGERSVESASDMGCGFPLPSYRQSALGLNEFGESVTYFED
jgi:hypothetical protein